MPVTNTTGSVDVRVPYPGLNTFRQFVVSELDRRKTSFSSIIQSPLTRMTACTLDPELRRTFFTLGLHGFDSTDLDIFDQSYGTNRDIVGYSYDLNSKTDTGVMRKRLHSSNQITSEALPTAANGALSFEQRRQTEQIREQMQTEQSLMFASISHPIPGITNVSVERLGPYAPFIANVTWVCYNRAQLEFLRHHFMVVGQYVVLEWGNNYTNKKITKMLDFGKEETKQILADAVLKGREYVVAEFVEPNDGNYDFLVGSIGTFNVNFDARTGVYECTTKIVSVGESIWGVNSHFTYVNASLASGVSMPITTIHDYFKVSSGFDEFINDNQYKFDLVAPYFAKFALNEQSKGDARNSDTNGSTNPEDYRFISWKFFVAYVIPEIFSMINGIGVNNILYDTFDFGIDQSGAPTDTNLSLEQQNWVGNNEYLKSTSADAMIITKTTMGDVPTALTNGGFFDQCPNSDGHRSKLTHGIWLNVGMIRNAFLSNNDFITAFKSILTSMNGATENFWKLALVWDDEISKYKIVDLNFLDVERKLPEFYKFNSANEEGASTSEFLKIDMDSAFPPELITQMMLYAKFKSENQQEAEELIKNFPLIGTTSNFMFSLNWTNLKDVLAPLIKGRNLLTSSSVIRGQSTTGTVRSNVASNASGTNTAQVVGGANGAQRGKPVGGNMPTQNTQQSQNVDSSIVTRTANSRNLRQRRNLGNQRGRATNSLEVLCPDFRLIVQEVITEFTRLGYRVVLNETGRDAARAAVYSSSGIGVADSPHRYGRAIDMNVYNSQGSIVIRNGRIGDSNSYVLALRRQLFVNAAQKYGYSANDFRFGEYISLRSDGRRDTVHVQFNRSAANTPEIPAQSLVYEGVKYEDALPNAGAYAGRPGFKSLSPNFQPRGDTPDIAEDEMRLAEQSADDIESRFHWALNNMIELFPSRMKNLMTKNGYDNYPKPNGFIVGFPTTTSVTIELPGMAGVSISDCFIVDRLPFVFEKYGVFQVTEIKENISTNGWLTTIRGYFKLTKVDK